MSPGAILGPSAHTGTHTSNTRQSHKRHCVIRVTPMVRHETSFLVFSRNDGLQRAPLQHVTALPSNPPSTTSTTSTHCIWQACPHLARHLQKQSFRKSPYKARANVCPRRGESAVCWWRMGPVPDVNEEMHISVNPLLCSHGHTQSLSNFPHTPFCSQKCIDRR